MELLSSVRLLRTIKRNQSLHEQTYQAIRSAILSGDLVAGSRLVETQLAEQLQVSRTPVREAIRQLQRENLITADMSGALRVAMLSVDDAVQLYDCRLALEQFSVMEACSNASIAQIEQLERMVFKAEKVMAQSERNLIRFQLLHLDRQFHCLIAEMANNPWLVTLLDQVFDKMTLLRLRTIQHNPTVLEVYDEHRKIFQAICDRTPQVAIAATQEHLQASKVRVVHEIQQLEQQLEETKPL
ncbi:MAG TPA: GntR family transcriptional regulator [Leptolyngbyaceae cyanobacterium M33_DOE_097]|uniref:GntR family transcriptional regulator n=1 Tax=Oscillatoriales cyanobacterium SpSt-418 TaxID=2282169 RepID=A0A7C3KBZ2_9CYAN|nr:GntR family transcriptional regulator [Leptolyngbyaceae cyanobacterium M33_DOE_097]